MIRHKRRCLVSATEMCKAGISARCQETRCSHWPTTLGPKNANVIVLFLFKIKHKLIFRAFKSCAKSNIWGAQNEVITSYHKKSSNWYSSISALAWIPVICVWVDIFVWVWEMFDAQQTNRWWIVWVSSHQNSSNTQFNISKTPLWTNCQRW